MRSIKNATKQLNTPAWHRGRGDHQKSSTVLTNCWRRRRVAVGAAL